MSDKVETPAELAGGAYQSTVRSKAEELKRELIRQTLDDIESWRLAVEVQWAQAHPDRTDSPPIPPEEVEGYRNTVRNEYYEWVVPAFERYLQPDPDATNPMIAALRTIESMFEGSQDDAGNFAPASPALSRVNDVRTDMGHWQGDLANNFVDNFLTPLQTVSVNQAAVAKVVHEVLELNKITYIRYRDAVIKLADKSIEAVKLLNNQRDPKPVLWGTLVGISIGTLLTLGTGGVAAVGAGLIVASTLSQGLIPDPPKKNDLAAPTAQEVAVKIVDAMNALDTDTQQEEQKLEKAFHELYTAISGSRAKSIGSNTSGPLAVATPAVATAKPGDVTDGSLRPDS